MNRNRHSVFRDLTPPATPESPEPMSNSDDPDYVPDSPDCDSDSDCDSLPPGSGPATTAAAPPPGFAPIARDLSGWTPSTPPRQQRFSRREQTLRLSVSRVGPFVREWTVADDPPDASAATLKRLLVRAGIITPETPIESLDLRELITLTPRRAAMRRTLAAELAKHIVFGHLTGYGMANAVKWALKNVKRRLTAVEDDLEGEWASYIDAVTALVDNEVQLAVGTRRKAQLQRRSRRKCLPKRPRARGPGPRQAARPGLARARG